MEHVVNANSAIVGKILAEYPTLSKQQKKVADFCIDNFEWLPSLTALEIAERSGTSEPTVGRFAHDLGFVNFKHFRNKVELELMSSLNASDRLKTWLNEADECLLANEYWSEIFTSDERRIGKLIHSESDIYEAVARRISHARKIYIMGLRASESLALFAAHYLKMIFPDVIRIMPGSTAECIEQIRNIGENDVFLVISFPRYSSRTIKTLKHAKKSKAYIVALTDKQTVPFANFVDEIVCVEAGMHGFVDALVAPFCLLSALIARMAVLNRDRLKSNLGILDRIWDDADEYTTDNNDANALKQGEVGDE